MGLHMQTFVGISVMGLHMQTFVGISVMILHMQTFVGISVADHFRHRVAKLRIVP